MAYRKICVLILALYIFSGQRECNAFQAFDNFGGVAEGVFNKFVEETIIQFSDLDQNDPKVKAAINFVINAVNNIINEATGDMNAMMSGAEAEIQKVLKAIQSGDEPISAAANEFDKELTEQSNKAGNMANA